MSIVTLLIGFVILVESATHNYWDALEKALYFYESQREGYLPLNRTSCWRFHAFLKDKGDQCEDLTGGWMESIGYAKLNYPMSAAVTMLAYGGIYYKQDYKDSGLFEKLLETIKWPLDYFIKCYINDKLIYVQCGRMIDEEPDMSTPEDNTLNRTCYAVTDSKPGTEVVASMAASLAAGYLLFKDVDLNYANILLDTAEKMFLFADTYKGFYTDFIPDPGYWYQSYNDYYDELSEAASLLYKSTNKASYLTKAEQYYISGNQMWDMWEQNWDNRKLAVNFMLYDITGNNTYLTYLNDYYSQHINVDFKLEGKLIYINEWDPLELAANDAFFAFLLFDRYGTNPLLTIRNSLVNYAKNNIDFILGSNSKNLSYLIGYGNFPKRYHHKASACPSVPHQCTLADFENDNIPNHHDLTGALLGGPAQDGSFIESKNNYQNSKISNAYNAGLTGALIRLFGSEQSVADVKIINRTCENKPDFYIGKSASNYLIFKNWLEGKERSPFEGCVETTNKINQLNSKEMFLEEYKDCQIGFEFNQKMQKCEKLICSENCLNCVLDNFENNNCTECSDNFKLYENECIPSDCFSDLCQQCVLEITFDCSICFSCKNLKFTQESEFLVKCSQIINNCQNCIYNNQNVICVFCEPSYTWSEEQQKCYQPNNLEIQNFKLQFSENNLLNKSCSVGYHYDLNLDKCFEISHRCEIGCSSCVLELDKCLICDNHFLMNNNRCVLNAIPSFFQNNSKDFDSLFEYFIYHQKNCTKITNNITLINFENVTVFLNEKEFSVGRDVEIKELFLDCYKEKSICEKIKNITFSQRNNCTAYNTETYEIMIKNYINVTVNDYSMCSTNSNYSKITNENIICTDEKCLNFKKTIEFEKGNNINKCEEYFFNKEREQLLFEKQKEKETDDECKFCQIYKNYFCEKRDECIRECEFQKMNNLEITNTLKDSIVDFDINILRGNLPDYANVEFDINQQKLIFRFIKNYPDFNFEINPKMVKNAQKCRIIKPIRFNIKNDNFSLGLQKINNQKPSNDPITAVISVVSFVGFVSITPINLYNMIQFNDLFNYVSILQISGGSFFNKVNQFSESKKDTDSVFLDEKKEFEFKMRLKEINSLFIISLLDFYFLFMIVFVIVGKIYLRLTVYSRYLKLKDLVKNRDKILDEYRKGNIFKKIWLRLKVFYNSFDTEAFIYKIEKSIFIQYICRIPLFLHIFTLKFLFINKYLFVVYFFLLFSYNSFSFYYITKIIKFLKDPSDIENREFLILINDERRDYELVLNDLWKNLLRFLLVSSIIIFKSFHIAAFISVSIFVLLMIVQLFIFLKRGNPFYNIVFFFLAYISFLAWIGFIVVAKYFNFNLEMGKNISYAVSNGFIFIAYIIESFYKRKLYKQSVNKIKLDD